MLPSGRKFGCITQKGLRKKVVDRTNPRPNWGQIFSERAGKVPNWGEFWIVLLPILFHYAWKNWTFGGFWVWNGWKQLVRFCKQLRSSRIDSEEFFKENFSLFFEIVLFYNTAIENLLQFVYSLERKKNIRMWNVWIVLYICVKTHRFEFVNKKCYKILVNKTILLTCIFSHITHWARVGRVA